MKSITVTLIHTPRSWHWLTDRRWQPWRWIAVASNGRTIATSGECYTNRDDAIDAVRLLFDPATTVTFRTTNADGEVIR